jgi:AraC-like DNA-binding protein
VSVGNAMVFWLFARALFEDDFVVRARHFAGWVAVAAIGGSFCLSLALLGPQSPVTVVSRVALRWVPAGFALLVIVAAASQWRADLVERRRRLRGFIVIAGAAYAAAMVAVRLAMPHGALSAVAAGFDTAALLVIVLVIGVAVLRVSDGGLLPAAEPAGKPAGVPVVGNQARTAPDPAEDQLAEALARLMQHERVYRIDDLTLGLLALKLGVPEYRLRRCINQRLGHRNFNAYVNALRLAQAREALADPARREASVLEIAMDAGFGSIGPFNRAFKAASGLTPSEFRRQVLADS